MHWGRWAGLGVAGAGTLLYGALFETGRLVGERHVLRLPDWPESLDGLKIGLFADLHLRGMWEEIALVQAAVDWLASEDPDVVVIAGDFVSWWMPGIEEELLYALGGLRDLTCPVLAIPGNHDYHGGEAGRLVPVLEKLGGRLLRNELMKDLGVNWVGVDSGNARRADPFAPLLTVEDGDPIVTLWHEPDLVKWLPRGVDLMLSGHSHGGQFTTPWGWAPMTSSNGSRYLRGFYPEAPVPLYVSRGLATTGPAARLFCRPEVTLLEIRGIDGDFGAESWEWRNQQ